MNFNELQIPPPKYWQQFEDLCLSIFRCVWEDPTAQKNGRAGQAQHGTDILGEARCDGNKFHGVQCKGKDNGLGAAVSRDELLSEVEKAKQFTPQLSHWILATTAPKNATIEAIAREITHKHKALGLFAVQVYGWEDLQSHIAKYPDIIRQFYPELAPIEARAPDSPEIIAKANQDLEEFGLRLRDASLAPLLTPAPGETVGENLIGELSTGQNVLLLGRSGLGKSFHLKHYRSRLDLNETPILLDAGHYAGDLFRAIHKTLGPYSPLTPEELIDAARRTNRQIVLVVDDWNKCAWSLQSALSDELASCQLRHGHRLVIASQQRPSQPFFSKFKSIELTALRSEQKEQIFSFHASPSDSGALCKFAEAFSTAFDLSIAGKICSDGNFPSTRWGLYDNYTRLRLPSAAARSTATQLAWFMGENFRPFLSMAEFERIGERITRDLKAPITVVEDVLTSGLVMGEAGTVTFEHDLLKNFFRAECLLREFSGQQLIERLLEPKYVDLAEFILPNIVEEEVVSRFLASAGSEFLSIGYRGWLGERTRKLIVQQCRDLLVKTRDRLPQVKVEAFVGELADGRKHVSAAYTDVETSATRHEAELCSVIAVNLDDHSLREAFLDLLDVGEVALKAAADEAAKVQNLKPLPVWREALRMNVVCRHNGPIHPLLLMCAEIRERTHFGKSSRSSALDNELLERARTRTAGSLALLLLMSRLRYSKTVSVADIALLFSQAWSTGIYVLQMESLDFVHSCATSISDQGTEAESQIVELLECVDVSKNVMLSTQWVETRAAFREYECGITTDDALMEYRRILDVAEKGEDSLWDLEREENPASTFQQFIGSYASSALGKIFEDMFQGVYDEAYARLTTEERKRLLTLALQDEQSHLFKAWYLRELRKLGCEGAEDIVARIGMRLDGDSFSPQEAVESFVIANEAWASISATPIPYADGSTPDHRAWALAGESIFWLNRPDCDNTSDRIRLLFQDSLQRPQAMPDVLRHLGSGYMAPYREAPLSALLSKHPDQLRALLNNSLDFEGKLTSLFKGAEHRQRELFSWLISTVVEIGDDESISKLRMWTDHSIYGRTAIGAIEAIEHRKLSQSRKRN